MGLTSSLRAVASPAHPLGVSGVLGAGLSPVSAQPGPPWALGAAGGLELAMSPPRLHCLLSYVLTNTFFFITTILMTILRVCQSVQSLSHV